jgi:hypothetical protein
LPPKLNVRGCLSLPGKVTVLSRSSAVALPHAAASTSSAYVRKETNSESVLKTAPPIGTPIGTWGKVPMAERM